MGEVWLAERVSDVGASKLVALKLMTFGIASEENYATFLQEARVSMSMNHPNIVQVFDAGVHDGRAWLDLEYVEGVDLARVATSLRTNRHLPSETAIVHLARSLLRALAHAHGLRSSPGGAGVVHRDVSPQNILVGHHGQLKLNDFGVARVVEAVPSATSPVGKIRYMPPEQAAGRVGPQSDLFGAGAVLHELLEGQKFRGHIPQAGMLRAAFDGVVAPISRPISPALHQLLTGLVCPDPRQRFQSAEAALGFMDQHSLLADASQEWAALSKSTPVAAPSPAPPFDNFESSLSGDPTEHGTAGTLAGHRRDHPTRTRVRDKRPRWVLPVAVLACLAVATVPGFFAWRAVARAMMPTYEFNTGSAACDDYMWAMSRFERGPGEPYYSEPELRRFEAQFTDSEEACIELVADLKRNGFYPTW